MSPSCDVYQHLELVVAAVEGKLGVSCNQNMLCLFGGPNTPTPSTEDLIKWKKKRINQNLFSTVHDFFNDDSKKHASDIIFFDCCVSFIKTKIAEPLLLFEQNIQLNKSQLLCAFLYFLLIPRVLCIKRWEYSKLDLKKKPHTHRNQHIRFH